MVERLREKLSTEEDSKRRATIAQAIAEGTRWQDFAACLSKDPEMFFPEKGQSAKLGKAVCAKCDVEFQCLQYAMETKQADGIWGGLSARERQKLRKQRRGASMYT